MGFWSILWNTFLVVITGGIWGIFLIIKYFFGKK